MRISSNVHNVMVRDIVVSLLKKGISSHTFSISKSEILTGALKRRGGTTHTAVCHTHTQHTSRMIRMMNTDVAGLFVLPLRVQNMIVFESFTCCR